MVRTKFFFEQGGFKIKICIGKKWWRRRRTEKKFPCLFSLLGTMQNGQHQNGKTGIQSEGIDESGRGWMRTMTIVFFSGCKQIAHLDERIKRKNEWMNGKEEHYNHHRHRSRHDHDHHHQDRLGTMGLYADDQKVIPEEEKQKKNTGNTSRIRQTFAPSPPSWSNHYCLCKHGDWGRVRMVLLWNGVNQRDVRLV